MRGILLFLLCVAAWAQTVPFEPIFRSVAGPRWIERAAQVKAESDFKADVTAFDGGMGLAQFMPGTWKWAQAQGWVPKGASAYEPISAITGQHRYMLYLEARTGSRLDPALGAYNAGLGSVRKAQLIADSLGLTSADAWLSTLPRVTGKNAAITQAYILRNRRFRLQIGLMARGNP